MISGLRTFYQHNSTRGQLGAGACNRNAPRPDYRKAHVKAWQQMQPSWELLGLFSAGSAAIGAIATAGILNAFNRRKPRDLEPTAKRQKLTPPSPVRGEPGAATEQQQEDGPEASALVGDASKLPLPATTDVQPSPDVQADDDAPGTPDADTSGANHMAHPDSVVDLQKLQELEQRVADLNALAELGKVYQDSLALSAQLRNLSSFRLQQDKVLGRGSLAVVQEGEYAGDSVAVKLLPIGSVFAEDSRKEACLALCLHHPNVVRVVGVHLVEVEGRPFLALVQEAAPGGDLGWQIEDCDFHMGKRGSATLDVSLKLLLDAARGLAYMHAVDVVHGDVKSRNLLVFWEQDEDEEDEQQEQPEQPDSTQASKDGGADLASKADTAAANGQEEADKAAATTAQQDQEDLSNRGSSPRPPVWALKWCDFGVSFRAAEAPGGVLRTVTGTPGFRAPEVMNTGWSKAADTYAFGIIAWQLLTGQKPIVYDREWRQHVENPSLFRVDCGSGPDAIPRTLADLVWDCGAYMPEQRPSMNQVVQRLEDIAMVRLQAEQEAEAAEAAAQQAKAAEAAAAAAKAAATEQDQAAAAEAASGALAGAPEAGTTAAGQTGPDSSAAEAAAAAAPEASAVAAAAAAAAADAEEMKPPCPVCCSPPARAAGMGGLARALSQQARDAAAGGAAADAAAAQQQLQQLLQKQHQSDAAAAAGNGSSRPCSAPAGSALGAGGGAPAPTAAAGKRATQQHHHTYEVLIENDDDPLTAEAVAHTLEQFEAGSLTRVLAGHPYALQAASGSHVCSAAAAGAGAGVPNVAAGAGQGRALHHSATAPVHSHLLDAAADAAVAAAAAGNGYAPSGSMLAPSAPVNITGAVSRASIALRPAPGPGLVPPVYSTTPPSPSAAAAGAAAAATSPGHPAAAAGAAAGAGGSNLPGSAGVPSGGWFLASGSSFKKGMWLEKLPGGAVNSPAHRVTAPPAAGTLEGSPLALGGPVSGPEAGSTPPGEASWSGFGPHSSFSLQIRRESALPPVAEDDLNGVWQAGGADATGNNAGSAAAADDGTAPAAAGSADAAAAARALRRSQTTRRLGNDVLAAAGALSKALSAFSSASQSLPVFAGAAAAGNNGLGAGSSGSPVGDGSAGVAASNFLLTRDFVAAAQGLSEALSALLPSAAALSDADPRQQAAAAAAASEAVQGLRSLQGRIASAAAATTEGGSGTGQQAVGGSSAVAQALQLMNGPQAAQAGITAGAVDGMRESAFAHQLPFASPRAAPIVSVAALVPTAAAAARASGSNFGGINRTVPLDGSWQVAQHGTDGAAVVAGNSAPSSNFFAMPRRHSLDESRSARAALLTALRQQQQQQQASGDAVVAGQDAAVAPDSLAASWSEGPFLLRMPSRRHSTELRRP